MKVRSFLACAVAGASMVAMLGVAHAKPAKAKPDATLHLKSKSVSAGVGFSWGSGKLSYKGKSHDIEVDGLTVGSVGANSIEATGKVYELKKLEDFDGNYTAVVAGGTLGGGGGALTMQNQNGVKVTMTATTRGLSLTAGVSGVKLSLKK